MTERRDLLTSIAHSIRDYRAGEIPEPTPDHVERWIRQFDADVQVPMLREFDHVFKRTYVSKAKVQRLLDSVISNFPCDFWRGAHILDIQQQGSSQTEIRNLIVPILKEKCGSDIEYRGSQEGTYVYLDDAIFTGERVIRDLTAWIRESAPQAADVHIMSIATHKYAEYRIETGDNYFGETKREKGINIHMWRFKAFAFENRRAYRDESDVLWPIAEVYDSAPFLPRTPLQQVSRVFSSEQGRELLEREFLEAGRKIRGFANDPSPRLKPLGFSPFEPGFGSLFVTYRNCPNNCPLALWYGDPTSYPRTIR